MSVALAQTPADGEALQPLQVDAAGNLKTTNAGGTPPTTGTATLTNVASSATNVTLSAANTARKSWYVFNDSTQVLFVKFGVTASNSSFTVELVAGAYYEMPGTAIYSGQIDGIWASAQGSARVTEL